MGRCTSRSWVHVILCAADRHRVTEMSCSTDFQIHESLCLASADIVWSLCFYGDRDQTRGVMGSEGLRSCSGGLKVRAGWVM